nr:FAD/NAD(P)-binding protein [Novosphingobium flavum]
MPIAIVGAGFSGTLLAIHILRHGGRVVLVERDHTSIARGLAYGTRRPEHLLNVRASNMSAFPDDPGHFLRWMGFAEREQVNRFVPRLAYGRYLRELLMNALGKSPDRIRIVESEAVDAVVGPGSTRLDFADGRSLDVRAVVLAIGNCPPRLPPAFAGLPGSIVISDPWQGAIDAVARAGGDVLLLGTALTAVDVILGLVGAGHQGRITALSRRGLVPLAHDAEAATIAFVSRPEGRGSWLLRHVRKRSERVGWRAAVDELRTHTQSLWRLHDEQAQRRFLRHLRPFWDAHRHRIAPAVAEKLEALQDSGRLRFAGGRILSAERSGPGLLLNWSPRGTGQTTTDHFDFAINCTGPEGDIHRIANPLLTSLIAQGRVRPDRHGLGIDVDRLGRAVDSAGGKQESLFVVGPLTKGEAWEAVAVPDIRRQVWELARFLTNSHVISTDI